MPLGYTPDNELPEKEREARRLLREAVLAWDSLVKSTDGITCQAWLGGVVFAMVNSFLREEIRLGIVTDTLELEMLRASCPTQEDFDAAIQERLRSAREGGRDYSGAFAGMPIPTNDGGGSVN